MRRLLLSLALCVGASRAFAWGTSAPDWLKELAKAPLPAYPSDTKGVALLDETITTVSPSGEVRTLHRRAYKVLSTEGKDLGYIAVPFDKEMRLTAFRAWAIGANGQEYLVKERDAVETGMSDSELYNDSKMKVLRIPAGEPGSIVAYEYEHLERPYSLQGVWRYQRSVPVKRSRYVVSLPEGWKYETHWFHAPEKAPQVAGNQLVWEMTDVDAIKDEPGMPAEDEIAARLAINFIPAQDALAGKAHRSWSDVAKWYAGLAATRRQPTPEMQAKVKELVNGKTTTLDKIRALAGFAQRDVRYVAIEIGIGGFQPHAASEIYANRYGDCKDKATVLSTMLREIGVESYYVLANTERGSVEKDFASLTAFNHAILAIKLPADVPAKELYALVKHPKLGTLLLFDPTSQNTPLGLLPPYLQENRVLLVTDDGGETIDVPPHPPESSQLIRSAKLTLDQWGVLAGEVREVRTGALARDYRDDLQSISEAERQKYVERAVGYHLNQYTVKDLVIENLDDVSKELVVHYHIAAQGYAKKAAGMLLLRPRLLGRKAEAILDLKERKYGYETQGPALEVDTVEIAVPAGLGADELPPPQSISTPAVAYTSESKFEGSTLKYHREYKVQRFGVPLEGLKELNGAFTKILADERGSAVLVAK